MTAVRGHNGNNARLRNLTSALDRDFDFSLAYEHIGDEAARPRYVETVPRRGYRYIGPIRTEVIAGPNRSVDDRESSPSESVIAVLPFADISPTSDSNYFCNGLAEEIIGGLTKVPGIRVVGRGSAALFRHRTLSLREIADRLNASFVLDGSLRQRGKRIRIMAQLVRAVDEHRLWSERYDRELIDLFQVQEEIARAIRCPLHVAAPTVDSDLYPSLKTQERLRETKRS